jgi:hypothetical protein
MDALERLYRKATKEDARFQLRFDSTGPKESAWHVKYFPNPDSNGNYWAEADTLDATVRQLLDEIEGMA